VGARTHSFDSRAIFSIPAVVAPTVEETMVATPIVSFPVTSTQENEGHVIQEHIKPVVTN
jgi:hypothetical protein